MNIQNRLKNYMDAAFPCVVLQTAEETRAIGDVVAAAKRAKKAILTWSATEGLKRVSPTQEDFPDTEFLPAACRERPEKSVIIFRDLAGWPFDREPQIARSFRDLITWGPRNGTCCVIVQSNFVPYPAIEKQCVVVDYALPGPEDLLLITKGISESAGLNFDPEEAAGIVKALSGLSTTEAENALALSVIETGRLSEPVIYREKIQQVKKSGLLEIIDPDPAGLDSIGGMDEVKKYILKRKKAYTEEARGYGLPFPKGILAIGPPGVGKSALAKVIGIALGVPTVRMDYGALFNSLVGESEARARAGFQLAEAISPCVLWIDEVDKALAGSSGANSGDSGVSRRVFGTMLTWMQENRKPIFVVMTANSIAGMDSAGFRKGRIDKIFAVDIPNSDERAEILKIHLKKRGRQELADSLGMEANRATSSFTGSEIEACIVEAMFTAFDEGRDITERDICQAALKIVPIIKTAKEEIAAIREWAKTRAEPATSKQMGTNQTLRQINAAGGEGGET